MARFDRRASLLLVGIGSVSAVLAAGCHHPEKSSFTGPRVYLIQGAPSEQSDGLELISHELQKQEINAKVYSPDDWLRIVVDIDARPCEEVILVGHSHGAFLATQVVRHYAQEHKTKYIEAVFTLDAYNKDWPHNLREAGLCDPHEKPMNIPIGHNALRVRNYNQSNPDSRRWGADLVTTRATDQMFEHPYYWYDDFWNRRAVGGQILAEEVTDEGVLHVTIDNESALVQRIIRMCRRAALSPYHYTPPEHHPDVQAKPEPAPRRAKRESAV